MLSRASREFFKIFQVFVQNLRGRVILGLEHSRDLHFQKNNILNKDVRILTGKAHLPFKGAKEKTP